VHDGGGIYTWVGDTTVFSGIKVLNNIVLNVTNDCGIYLDHRSNNITVSNNTVYGCEYGIYLNNAYSNVIRQNVVYNNSGAALLLGNAQWSQQLLTGNTINSNQFISKGATDRLVYADPMEKIQPGLSNDSNIWARPLADADVFYYLIYTPTFSANNKTLAQWQAYTGQDIHSKKSPKTISSTSDIEFRYNATSTAQPVSFSWAGIDMNGTQYSSNPTLQPYTSLVLIKNIPNPTGTKKMWKDSQGMPLVKTVCLMVRFHQINNTLKLGI